MKKVMLSFLVFSLLLLGGCSDVNNSENEVLENNSQLNYEISKKQNEENNLEIYIDAFYKTKIKDDDLNLNTFSFPNSKTYDSYKMLVENIDYDTSKNCYISYFANYPNTYQDLCLYQKEDTYYNSFNIVIENNQDYALENLEIVSSSGQIGFTNGGVEDKNTEIELKTDRFSSKA
jgi:major membrane immunogen (membrane-anchored lipoprotein)